MFFCRDKFGYLQLTGAFARQDRLRCYTCCMKNTALLRHLNGVASRLGIIAPIVGYGIVSGLRFSLAFSAGLLMGAFLEPDNRALFVTLFFISRLVSLLVISLLHVVLRQQNRLLNSSLAYGLVFLSWLLIGAISSGVIASAVVLGACAVMAGAGLSAVEIDWLDAIAKTESAKPQFSIPLAMGFSALMAFALIPLGFSTVLALTLVLLVVSFALRLGMVETVVDSFRIRPTATQRNTVLFAAFYLCFFALVNGAFGVMIDLGTHVPLIMLAGIGLAAIGMILLSVGLLAHRTVLRGDTLAALVAIAVVLLVPFVGRETQLLLGFLLYGAYFVAAIGARTYLCDLGSRTDINPGFYAGLILAGNIACKKIGEVAAKGALAQFPPFEALLVLSIGCGLALATFCVIAFVLLSRADAPLASAASAAPATPAEPVSAAPAREPAVSGSASAAVSSDDVVAHLTAPFDAARENVDLERLAKAYGLTPREREVAGYLAQGRSRTYIADDLGLSANTVRTHISNIYLKCGVGSKQEFLDLLRNA